MRLIYKIFFAAIAATGLSSCEDATDIIQPGELNGSAVFSNVDDLQAGIFGVYSGLVPETEIEFTSIFTDEVSRGEGNGGQGYINDALATFQLNANTGDVATIWNNHYSTIFRANTILEAAASITPQMGEEDTYNKVIAEALTIRAYSHSILLFYYGEDASNDSAPGVPYVDFVPGLDFTPARNTTGEVINAILADLQDAETNFLNLTTPISNSQRTFLDEHVVRAIRARLAVQSKNYVLAEQMADLLIAQFPEATAAEFPSIWTDANIDGVIFKALRTNQTGPNVAGIWFTNSTDFAGSAVFEMSRQVYNALAQNPSDVRFGNTYLDASTVADPNYQTSTDPTNTDLLIINKYPGNPNLVSLLKNDIKMFRTSEMTFIKIESRIANNDLSGAAALMQGFRQNRYATAPLPTYGSQQDAYIDLLNERRVELWLEGHRYLDVSRLGVLANQGYERDPIDCIVSLVPAACQLSFNDVKTKYLPLPQPELAANPNITQGDGY